MTAGRGGRLRLAIAVDVGTSGARAVAVDLRGSVAAQARRSYPTATPRPGWAEQDPEDWSGRATEALEQLVQKLGESGWEATSISLTGQCPTVAPFDERGRPLGPGLLYRDNRAAAEAMEMRERIGAERMHRLTGHLPEAFHAGPKVLWLRRAQPEVFAATAAFLQPRDAVLLELTGVQATDQTHANATLFYDLRSRCWSEELLAAFDVAPTLFPDALAPWAVAGALRPAHAAGLGPVPVVVGAADSQCAAFGAGVVEPGPISEMAGASTCINSTVLAPLDEIGITHYSHAVPDVFCTEVGLNTAGAALEWGRRALGFDTHADLEAAAAGFRRRQLGGGRAGPVDAAPLFLPYLADGERIDPLLRGAFVGLSSRHDSSALAYSVIEGVALAVGERVALLRRAGCPLTELRCSGGGGRHALLAQVKADLLGVPVRRFRQDATSTGCALLGATQAGHAEEVAEAVDRLVRDASLVEPDRRGSRFLAERRPWFDSVLEGAAIRRAGGAP